VVVTISVTGLELRLATAADEPMLRRLYASTRADEMALVPWTDAEKRSFCDMQFDAQDRHYRAEYRDARFDVVVVDGQPAGRLTVSRTQQCINVVDIAVLPEFRGGGIATALLEGLQAEARLTGRRVALAVEIQNPAAELYRRLGFAVTETVGIHQFMSWVPS
jgi:GNAT superfamily N-acetyltransferase